MSIIFEENVYPQSGSECVQNMKTSQLNEDAKSAEETFVTIPLYEEKTGEKVSKTFRHKFSDEFVNEIFAFSKIHQYDARKIFKEEWNKWIETIEIQSLVNIEKKNLSKNGFIGDVMDKIFKSARYYYRKKSNIEKPAKERKEYTGLSKDFLKSMDNEIEKQIITNKAPAEAYEEYVKCNKESFETEFIALNEKIAKTNIQIEMEEFTQKIKKTYKNRYYLHR